MEDLFHESIRWPPQSSIVVETSDHCSMILQTPILKHRWPLFRNDQDSALALVQTLTKDQLKSILLYIYSDLPAKGSMSHTFELCQLSHPLSLQQSTFVEDMRNLMHDDETSDFELVAEQGHVRVHRCILAARSRYFRSLFLTESSETISGFWQCHRPIPLKTLQFFVEYLYTGQISVPETVDIIPLCWMVKYLRLSGEKEVENIIVSAMTRNLCDETQDLFFEIATQWDAQCVIDVIEKHKSTKGV